MDPEQHSAQAFGVQRPEKRRGAPLLHSLSSYSRRIVSDNPGSWPSFRHSLQGPFCNIKIEIFNSQAPPLSAKGLEEQEEKEEGGSSPPRKRFALSASTPDRGGARDTRFGKSQSPPWSPVTALEARSLTLIGKAVGDATSGRTTPRSGPHPVSTDSGVGSFAPPPLSTPDQSIPWTPSKTDVDHAFDFDLENILNLSPIGSGASDDDEDIEAFIESCHSFYESSLAQGPDGQAQSHVDHAPSPIDHAPSPGGYAPSLVAYSLSLSDHAPSPVGQTQGTVCHAQSPSSHTQCPVQGTAGDTQSSVGHAPGPVSQAPPPADHAQGPVSQAPAPADHAQGLVSQAPAPADHAQGPVSQAPAPADHAQGPVSQAPAPADHAQGPALSPAGKGGKVGGDGLQELCSLDDGYFSRPYRRVLRRRPWGVGQSLEVSPLQCPSLAPGAGLPSSSQGQEAEFGGGALPSPALCRNLLSSLDDVLLLGAAPAPKGVAEDVGEGAGLNVAAPGYESSLKRGSFPEGNREAGGRGLAVKAELAERALPSPCEGNTGSLGDKAEPIKKSCNSAQLSTVQRRPLLVSQERPSLPGPVRSVVVVPLKRADPDSTQSRRRHIKRPVVYEREADWEREKELYVSAVTSHMADSAPSGGGAMTELASLMKTVARQGASNGNKPWQHPSDLTCRNHKASAGKARVSLDEWVQRNQAAHRRFADVPAIFRRHPIPRSRTA